MEISAVSRESGLRCTVEVGHDETVLGLKGKVCAALWGGAVDEARLASVALCAASASGDAPLGADDTHVGTLGVEAGDEVHLVRLHACIKGPATYRETPSMSADSLVLTSCGSLCITSEDGLHHFDIWDTETATVLKSVPLSYHVDAHLVLTPCDRWLVTLATSSTNNDPSVLQVWDTTTWECLREVPETSSDGLALSPCMRWLVSTSLTTLNVRDFDTLELLHTRQHPDAYMTHLSFTPCSKHMWTTNEKDVVRFDTDSWEITKTLCSQKSCVQLLKLSPCCKYAIVACVHYLPLELWDVEAGVLLFSWNQIIESLCCVFSKDSTWCAVVGHSNMVTRFDVASGAILENRGGVTGNAYSFALSPCEKWYFIGGNAIQVLPVHPNEETQEA